MTDKERLSFEEALLRLQDIVTQLEKDDLQLEASIKLYEEGVVLSKLCTSLLEDATLRIETLK